MIRGYVTNWPKGWGPRKDGQVGHSYLLKKQPGWFSSHVILTPSIKTCLLGYNCFTMLCWFLLYNNVNQPCCCCCCSVASVVSDSVRPHRRGSPPGSPVPGIFQARTLEWGAISFSNAWRWKEKVKSLSHVRLLATPWTAAYQAPLSMGYSRQEYWSGVPLPSLKMRL